MRGHQNSDRPVRTKGNEEMFGMKRIKKMQQMRFLWGCSVSRTHVKLGEECLHSCHKQRMCVSSLEEGKRYHRPDER